MLITCPNCATSHEVPDDFLGSGGRKLRCSACRQIWHAQAADAVTPMPEDETTAIAVAAQSIAAPAMLQGVATATPEMLARDEPEPQAESQVIPPKSARDERSPARKPPSTWSRAPRQKRPRWPGAAIAACLCVMLALLALRPHVVRIAPQTARLYAMIGLPVNLRGLDIGDVSGKVFTEPEGRFLVISGSVANPSGHPIALPSLRLALRNDAGQEIYSWTAKLDADQIQAGEIMPFKRRLASPPAEATTVQVRFLSKNDLLLSSNLTTTAGARP